MSSRDLILARVRRALAGVPDVEITRAYRGPSERPGEIGLFEERVRDYRAVVHLVDEPGVAERVALSLAARGARRVVVPAGFPAPWLAAADAEAVADDPPLSAADLGAADGVLTTCAVAIAETGTIVLDAGPGQGRRALSLVPDYHLCVVRAAQIVAGVPDAVARLAPARPLTWISGPSATSDIELNRVEGVHGPRTLEVLIVT
ncbi:lactate utilization protein C [Microbispora rosea]|uniref:lactate utilization protein C n=1 Tax=Microbispora rosea TaxID=58117 RepID=UPI003787EDE8